METDTRRKSRQIIQEESLKSIANVRTGSLGLSMGIGKTKICLEDYTRHLNGKKILVVGPKLLVKKTWEDEIEKWGYQNVDYDFSTYISFAKKDINKYAGIYFDEFHNILPHHAEKLNQYNGRVIAVSGTPPTYKRGIKYEIMQKHFPLRYVYLADSAITDKILNNCRFIVHLLDITPRKFFIKLKNGKSFPTTELKAYEYWTNKIEEAELENNLKSAMNSRLQRMKVMQKFPTKEHYAKELVNTLLANNKCLVFASSKEQADSISHYSYHSGNPKSEHNLELFKQGNIRVLSAVEQLSEGANIPMLKYGVIMYCNNNPTKTVQKIGRLLRLSPEEMSEIHILCYNNTVDVKWVKSALQSFSSQEIIYKKIKDY